MFLSWSAILLSNFEQFLHGLHMMRKLDFFSGCEQRNPADAAQVITD